MKASAKPITSKTRSSERARRSSGRSGSLSRRRKKPRRRPERTGRRRTLPRRRMTRRMLSEERDLEVVRNCQYLKDVHDFVVKGSLISSRGTRHGLLDRGVCPL
jgi:hypothetical protein